MNKSLLNDPATWTVEQMLERLFLFHIAKNLPELTQTAAQKNFSHKEFLYHCLDTERVGRYESRVKRLIREAKFPQIKTIDTFDWTHPTSIPKQMILNAFNMEFVEKKEHFIFVGPGGVGKTHLAIALGYAACQRGIKTLYSTVADLINHLVASQADHSLGKALKRYTSPWLLVLDELGYLPLDKQGRDLIFQVISKRAGAGSIILTTNKAFKDWGETFQDTTVATAIAERLVEHGELVKIEGSSYRVRKRRQKSLGLVPLKNKD